MTVYLIYRWGGRAPLNLSVELGELLAQGPIVKVIEQLSMWKGEPTIIQSLRPTGDVAKINPPSSPRPGLAFPKSPEAVTAKPAGGTLAAGAAVLPITARE